MEATKPLYIHPWPISESDMNAIREAKAALDLPFKVIPRPLDVKVWGRVLALREAPSALTDYALVSDPDSPERLQAALSWVLSTRVDPRATTVLKTLQSIMGGDVREVDRRQMAVENFSKNMKFDDGKKIPIFQ